PPRQALAHKISDADIIAGRARILVDGILTCERKDIGAAQLHHLVGAAEKGRHAARAEAAGAFLALGNYKNVAQIIANEGRHRTVQAGGDEGAALAERQFRARVDIDRFDIDRVFADMLAVL